MSDRSLFSCAAQGRGTLLAEQTTIFRNDARSVLTTMTLRTVYFFSLLCAAFALVPAGAHLAELVNKIKLDVTDYQTDQQIYRGWELFGVVVVGALVRRSRSRSLCAVIRPHSRRRSSPASASSGTQVVFHRTSVGLHRARPLQFVTTLRTRRPWVHRRIGRVVLASGLVTGVSALAMMTQMAIGGATQKGQRPCSAFCS